MFYRKGTFLKKKLCTRFHISIVISPEVIIITWTDHSEVELSRNEKSTQK